MGVKELRISANELHRLGIQCSNNQCQSEIIFEATAERGPGDASCPNCSAPIPNIGSLVAAYRAFFKGVPKDRVSFLIRLENDE